MNFNFINKLPTPMELKKIYPVSLSLTKNKEFIDLILRDIFYSKLDKFIVIVGPCSSHDRDAVLFYAEKLAKVYDKLKDKILIIPRIYTNKPRTDGSGYKGLLHQPDPSKEPNMLDGIIAMRKLHMDVISNTGFSTADEMLYPENHRYLNDILSYVAVGARSVENQFHRLSSSGVGIPCGMKNPTSGDLRVMLNSIQAAHDKHTFIYRGWEVNTAGNPLAHSILRGFVNDHGEPYPNYHYEDIYRLYNMYYEMSIDNPAVIIDASHANSAKKYKEQIRIVKEIIYYRNLDPKLHNFIKGVMIESFLEEGSQSIEENTFGKSITDPCLGWNDTEKLLYYIAEHI